MLAEMLSRSGTSRIVARSLDELLAGVTSREPFGHTDGKSETVMERVVIDRQRFVVKHLHPDHDWIARAYGDLCSTTARLWESGLYDALPDCIDHAIVGVAAGLGRNQWGVALLMRDVGDHLVPPGDEPIPLDQHIRFLDHMATLHATFWRFEDRVGLTPFAHRWMIFGPGMLMAERATENEVPHIAVRGWRQFDERVSEPIRSFVNELRGDLDPLVRALAATPHTFVHGDWKLGNLGSGPDGRTILIDWQSPGEGPAAADLTWYLAINAARLPQAKEAAIAAYRDALEAHGVSTGDWFDEQLDLALLGTLVQFGWEKALGADEELDWWVEGARRGRARL
jgi:hypothetical protein